MRRALPSPPPHKERRFIPRINHGGFRARFAVSEEEIMQAMVWLLERAHTLAEGAGAASLAAAYRLRNELQGKKVGIVCSGGNASLEQLKKVLAFAGG